MSGFKKILLFVAIFFSVLFVFGVFRVWQVKGLFADFKAMVREEWPNPCPGSLLGIDFPRKPGFEIDLIQGFTPPEKFTKTLSEKGIVPFSTPFGRFPGRPVDMEAIRKESGIDDPSDDFEKKLLKRLSEGFSKIPPIPPTAAFINLSAPTPRYRTCRETGRFWYFLGRKMMEKGKWRQALQTMLGIALLANHMENSEVLGVSLTSRMVGITLREMAWVGLLEIAGKSSFTESEVHSLFKAIDTLASIQASMATILSLERLEVPSMGIVAKMEIDKGVAVKVYGRKPVWLTPLLADSKIIEPYLKEAFDPVFEALRLPYPEAIKRIETAKKWNEDLQIRVTNPWYEKPQLVFNPGKYFIELVMALKIPSLKGGYERETYGRQLLIGVKAAFALYSFRDRQKRWPSSIQELEKEFGISSFQDLYTGKALLLDTGNPPRLYSAGPDGNPENKDDLLFVPIWGNIR